MIGVCGATIMAWENRRLAPEDRHYPEIIAFLGYEPWKPPTTFGEALIAERRRRGLSVKAAAALLKVARAAFHKWEVGVVRPNSPSQWKLQAFLTGDR